MIFLIASCGSDDDINTPNHCNNGVLDGDETGIDCGGSCDPCEASDITSYYIKGSIDGTPFDFQQLEGNTQVYAFGAGSQVPGLCSSSNQDGVTENQFINITSFQNLYQGVYTFNINFNVDFGAEYYDFGVEEKLDFILNSITLNSSYSFDAIAIDCHDLVLVYTDESGKEWSTMNGSQSGSSSFVVTEIIPFTGFPRLNSGVIRFNFNCTVFDENSNSISITNGEGLSLFGNFN